MNRVLACSAVLLALAFSPALAGGINLAWDDCGWSGRENKNFSCDTNAGEPFTLLASFDPTSTMPDLVSLGWEICLRSAGAELPAWWRFAGSQCRAGSMILDTDFTAGPWSCADPWSGSIGIQGFSYDIDHHGPATARVLGNQSIATGSPVLVESGTEYYAFRLRINRAKTVGPDACAGCQVPVLIELNQITRIGLAGEFRESAPRDRNYVTWWGGAVYFFGCPHWVPTRSSTWGSVKSLYR